MNKGGNNNLEGLEPIRHLYVHIPFCARICPYCAFYKDRLDRSQTQRFCEALLAEIDQHAGCFRSCRDYLSAEELPPLCRPRNWNYCFAASRKTRSRRSLNGRSRPTRQRLRAQGGVAATTRGQPDQPRSPVLGRRLGSSGANTTLNKQRLHFKSCATLDPTT